MSGGNDNNAKNLQACIGECEDGQCALGLKCFQRSNGEAIPGCKGSGAGTDWDYCYDPSNNIVEGTTGKYQNSNAQSGCKGTSFVFMSFFLYFFFF